MSLLEVKHLSKWYESGVFHKERTRALQDISFSIEVGETLGLAGTSGAGKSTLVRCIMGLLHAEEGKIFYRGVNLAALSGTALAEARKSMHMVFQNPGAALNPRMTIRDSLVEPCRLYHVLVMKEDIEAMLDRFQLRHELLTRYPAELSGGELQRVSLARLLLIHPKLLILDEPTSMLDVSVQADIMRLLLSLQQETGISYLLISHDLDLLCAGASRVGIMKEGRLLELDKTETLFRNPRIPYTKELITAFQDF